MGSDDKYYLINGTLIHANQLDELYHAGRLGMKWGKHLPGTDWWKETTAAYLNTLPYGKSNKEGVALTKNTFKNRVRANLHTTKEAAKMYGNLIKNTAKAYGASAKATTKALAKNVSNRVSYAAYKIKKGTSKIWNSTKGFTKDQINNFKSLAKKSYNQLRSNVHDVFRAARTSYQGSGEYNSKTPMSHLDSFMKSQYGEAVESYRNSMSNGNVGNMINSFIQTSQFNIVRGVNNFLKNIGMDDEVDKFISKFKGESNFTKNMRLKELNRQMNNGDLDSEEKDLKKRYRI